MYFRNAELADCKWVYDLLEELRHPVHYTEEQFEKYYKECLESNFFRILIFQNEERLGLVSLNKFFMPRYLGYGYEMEEFAVHKAFRGKGLSYKMIEEIKKMLQEDPQTRKLIIKSNGEDSMHIYSKALNETDLKTYQVYLNKL